MRPGRRTRKRRALQAHRARWRWWSSCMARLGLAELVEGEQWLQARDRKAR